MTLIYKYLPLTGCLYRKRFFDMVMTNRFWLSKYYYLNDPMEGIYYAIGKTEQIMDLAKEKAGILIGCFGKNPTTFNLWAYYTNGYKGVCIEIELSDEYEEKLIEVKYLDNELFNVEITANIENAREILSRKLISWKDEDEIRLLHNYHTPEKGESFQLGIIRSIYIGVNIGEETLDYLMRKKPVLQNQKISWHVVSPIDGIISFPDIDLVLTYLLEYQNHRNKFKLFANQI